MSKITDFPDFSAERAAFKNGARLIAGADEVGRGPLAGPVVACAVILDLEKFFVEVKDSKKMSAKQREACYLQILHQARSVSIVSLPSRYIDQTNILLASLDAIGRAIANLSLKADYALIDGPYVPKGLNCHSKALIKGDQKSISIAAASIIAKVVRDRMMQKLDHIYRGYHFVNHLGYGTKKHKQALEMHGPILGIHRFSFAPIKNSDLKKEMNYDHSTY